MAALLIRIASLALPSKLRKKYLRAWLAELQDAKQDGEGWAFAYDLLVNMGSLKEAAQGKDILYRNHSKTPLWLSMGSVGTAILATVVAVNFWGGLKTPTNFGETQSTNPVTVIAPSVNAPLETVQRATVQQEDFQAALSDVTKQAESLAATPTTVEILSARQNSASELLDTTNIANSTSAVREIATVNNNSETPTTVGNTTDSSSNISVTENPQLSTTDIPTAESEGDEIIIADNPNPPPAPISAEASAERLITPVVTAETIETVEESTEEFVDTRGRAADTALGTTSNTSLETGSDIVIEAEALVIPDAIAVQPVPTAGIPGEAGVPNIPGIESASEEVVETIVELNSAAPAPVVVADVPLAAAPTAPIVGLTQDNPNVEISASEAEFEALSDVTTTVITREVEVQIPEISDDVTAELQQKLRDNALASAADLADSDVSADLTNEITSIESGNLEASEAARAMIPTNPDTSLGPIGFVNPPLSQANGLEAMGPAGPAGPAGPVGPVGAQGPVGPVGPVGAPSRNGAAGAQGPAGISCFDLNRNGVGDPNEDRNGDGRVDSLDCNGAPGSPGRNGAAGPQGPVGPVGPVGQAGANGGPGPVGPVGAPSQNGPQGPVGPVAAPIPNSPIGSANTPNNGLAIEPLQEQSPLPNPNVNTNPLDSITDEVTNDLIKVFLDSGDLSFENSAELIDKLGESLGLSEEEIRELLIELVRRLEP